MGEWRETARGGAYPWFCDQFGHMNVRFYAHAFDDAAFQLWSVYGIGHKWMAEHDVHTVTARTTTDFIKEVAKGELFVVESGFARLGNKSINFKHRMLNSDTGALHATQDCVEVFFDPATRKSAPIPDNIREVVAANLLPEPEKSD